MILDLKEEFEVIEEGTRYRLPEYEIIDGQGLALTRIHMVPRPVEIRFVRGSKLGKEEVEKKRGTLHEHLLAMMIHDLKYKNSLVPSREGSLVITKLEEALGWLRQRQIDRIKRDVVGTYQK